MQSFYLYDWVLKVCIVIAWQVLDRLMLEFCTVWTTWVARQSCVFVLNINIYLIRRSICKCDEVNIWRQWTKITQQSKIANSNQNYNRNLQWYYYSSD